MSGLASEKLHILHVAASLGPESAAGRLCISLQQADVQVTALAVDFPVLADAFFFSSFHIMRKLRRRLGQIPLYLFSKRDKVLPWSSLLCGHSLETWVRRFRPDIVHMHWIGASTIDLSSLRRLSVPIVWTFHDVWPLTAGCHCNMGCEEWRIGCKHCPQLGAGLLPIDLSSWFFQRKQSAIQQSHITGIAPSRWLAEMTAQSPLWYGKKICHLGNALDTKIFAPEDTQKSRRVWGLPDDKPIILFGATVTTIRYKGFSLLVEALNYLKRQGVDAHLAVFGENPSDMDLQFPATNVGYVHDPVELAALYSAADVFVAPSMQDNLPTTVLEASACGVPSVAFAIGGIPDIILQNESGYLAQPFDIKELAYGIRLVLDNPKIRRTWGNRARTHILDNYESRMVAKQHIALYQQVLQRN